MQSHAPTQKELVRGPVVFLVVWKFWVITGIDCLGNISVVDPVVIEQGEKLDGPRVWGSVLRKIILALALVKRLSTVFQWKAGNTQQKYWTLHQRELLVKTDKGIFHVWNVCYMCVDRWHLGDLTRETEHVCVSCIKDQFYPYRRAKLCFKIFNFNFCVFFTLQCNIIVQ